MKRILFSGLFIALAILANSQCLTTFAVLKNGAGNSTFPGFGNVGDNNYQAADASYKISGQVEVSFSSVLPNGTPAPAILAVNQTSPGSQAYNYKYAFATLSADRTSAVYNFYGTSGSQNLPNGAQVKYTINIQYLGQAVSTCLEVKNVPPPIALPVRFSSFTASRTSETKVSIAWTTASEQNNRGFNVQKNVNGEWKTIAFVFSQTLDGNSTSALTYSYNDPNMEKGITQYRVQQVDIDGHFTYSDIRAIRGETVATKLLVYPNPSADGKVNVVFDDNMGLRDVQVNDMQGKVIKSYKGISSNILVIERLTSGFYTIKVTNPATAASSVQKVIIK
jgi:hypothetical protein